ncbi:MAG: glycoside hydrolase family 13 protein, partial [Clostridia bacterium]|nr:glycoside hydrolase family 13 protein [Clostridia bacterium]
EEKKESAVLYPKRVSCGREVYEYTFKAESADLYFFYLTVDSTYGRFYSHADNGHGRLSESASPWQFTVYERFYETPDWLRSGIIYHVFVDRFAKGSVPVKKRKDAVMLGWDDTPEYPKKTGDFLKNNTFYGGTLYGVAEKLDYIASLGASCIYLSPIFEAYSNHKYDTGNFLKVDEMFGGDKALEYLIKKASEYGIRIVLDGVFNHVGDDSVYFNKYKRYKNDGAYQGKTSKYYEWFTFNHFPDHYAAWWGITNLPRVNRCKSYRDFICRKVIPKYMKMGIGGFRLDVVDELERDFLKQIVKTVKKEIPDAAVIGEVWEDVSNKRAYGERKHYLEGKALDSATDYPLRNAVISFARTGDSTFLKETVRLLYRHYPKRNLDLMMNFLGSHDTERILTVLGGDIDNGECNDVLAHKHMSDQQRERAIRLLKLCYTLIIGLPGVPCVFYGDEAGVEGYHDPFNRRTYPWSECSKRRADTDLTAYFAALGNIRKTESALCGGDLSILDTDHSTFAFCREKDSEEIVVLSNMSSESRLFSQGTAGSIYEDLVTKEKFDSSIAVDAMSA